MDPRIHIGLGKTLHIDRLEVQWNGGNKETYQNILTDRYITIQEGIGILDVKR
jgi:hypothetical protein